jgi:hypothetical protein
MSSEFLWLKSLPVPSDDRLAYVADDDGPLDWIGPFGNLTIFVGANNTGKSRLLRFLFKQIGIGVLDSEAVARRHVDALKACAVFQTRKGQFGAFMRSVGHDVDFERLADSLNARARGASQDTGKDVEVLYAILRSGAYNGEPQTTHLLQCLATALGQPPAGLATRHRIYVPALRTAARFRPRQDWETMLNEHERDVLSAVAIDRFFRGAQLDGGAQILSGLALYTRLLRLITGPRAQRDAVRRFESFLSKHFFAGREVSILPRCSFETDQQTLHLMVGEIERPLHELGDGLGSLIILLAPFFTEPEGTWIYIEEPELYLHPGYQRLFVDTILRHEAVTDRAIRAVVATHSNHLVGVATHNADKISVFRFASLGGDRFSVTAVRPESLQLLRDLGVHNASVLLAGCSIWVEGPSDRDYVRAGLLAYRRHLNVSPLLEDLHFAIFEYGGSNIVHYDFSRDDESGDPAEKDRRIKQRWLANRVFLLADRDEAPVKAASFAAWERQQGASDGALKVARTEGREIENELSAAILQKALPRAFRNRCGSAASAKFVEGDYKSRKMGEYLDEVMFGEERHLSTESGALKSADKVTLAATVLDMVEAADITWADLAPPFQTLIEAMWNFIATSNKLP